MGLPGDDIIDRVRARLCARLVRQAAAEGREFRDAACVGWVATCSNLFELDWLERFFPARPPTLPRPGAGKPGKYRDGKPPRRIRSKNLREWWEYLLPRVLAWGREQPWGRNGEGVEGLLGGAYERAAELWDRSGPSFVLPPDRVAAGEPGTTDCPLTWIKAIVSLEAAARPPQVAALVYDPPAAAGGATPTAATATSAPDRDVMAARVTILSTRTPVPVPDSADRIGGRGTLQLLLVVEQLETALGLTKDQRDVWCARTIGGRTPGEVAGAMGIEQGHVNVLFNRSKNYARKALAARCAGFVPPG